MYELKTMVRVKVGNNGYVIEEDQKKRYEHNSSSIFVATILLDLQADKISAVPDPD